MSAMNFEVVRRHYQERFTTAPHTYFSGTIPVTVCIIDEITIEITKKTREVTIDRIFPEGNKIIKIELRHNGQLLDHDVLTARQQEIEPERLEWLNLTSPRKEVICPAKVRLNRDYKAGERIQLTIETLAAFETIPEDKDSFLPSIEFEPMCSSFLDAKYWPREANNASISYVLPKGLKAVSMTSKGPDFISEFKGNSFIGWVFRGGEYDYLRYWFVAQIPFLYFLLLYLVIPGSGVLAIIVDCFKTSLPPTIIAMLCGSYLVARYHLYERTLMPPVGDIVILTTFITLLLSIIVEVALDFILLTVNLFVVILPWIAFYLRHRDTKRNREKNDPLISRMEKKFCHRCGMENKRDDNFCWKCGEKSAEI